MSEPGRITRSPTLRSMGNKATGGTNTATEVSVRKRGEAKVNWFKVLVMQYTVEDKNPPSKQWAQVNRGQIDQCLDKTKRNKTQWFTELKEL